MKKRKVNYQSSSEDEKDLHNSEGESESELQSENESLEIEQESNCSDSHNGKELLNPEEESDKDNDDTSDENDEESKCNAGWADAVSKILKTKKPKGKSLVLGKAKKLTDFNKEKVKPAEPEETEDTKSDPGLKRESTSTAVPHKKRKEFPSLRIQPNILEKDRERTLSKIATKGVVQLFNAVNAQQRQIDNKLKEAGPLEIKKEKVLKNLDKRAFLDVLMGEKSKSISVPENSESKKQPENSSWNILRDDFMMDAKLKDWDKQLEEEIEQENEAEIESE